jgi:hypothetical protein
VTVSATHFLFFRPPLPADAAPFPVAAKTKQFNFFVTLHGQLASACPVVGN